jgi:ABC-2 type transport system permease protein
MSRRTGPALIAHQLRYELRSFRRDRQAALSTVVLPLALLAAFVGLAGRHTGVVQNGRRVPVATFYIPGLIAFAIVAASFATLLVEIVARRQAGVLKRRRATPVPAWALIAARLATCVVVAALTTVLLLAVGRNTYDVVVPASALPAVALTLVAGTAAFACLSYALAPLISDAGAAQPVIQVLLLPLYVISGVLLPDSKNPHLLREIAAVFPLEHIAHGLHRAFAVPHPGIGMTSGDVAILLAWTAGGLLVAIRRFAWLPR